MKKTFMLAVLICLLWTIPCYAQSESITNGATWLSANQNSDGSWGARADLALVCSAEAVNALISSGTGTTVSALNWLTSQNAGSNDELSRTIISLASAGTNSTALVSSLINNKNLDGGWGFELGNSSDNLDTALAISALHTANYSDTTVQYLAVNFLTANQNADGGWGFRPVTTAEPADASNAYVTAMVLRALSGYSPTFSVQSSVDKGKAYLLTKQNADGGFGSSPSNVYETALSIISLIESGRGSTQALQNALNYLTTAQLANGSWNDDPYSTALALQALAAARPNITVSSITLSKPMPQENETITITTTVNNTGLDSASNVIVRFYLGDPATGGTRIGTDQVIPVIAVGLSAQVSISQSFTGTGGKTIFVVADPDNLISETTKADNKASARIWVAMAPDLAVFSEDLKPSTYVPTPGTAFTLAYTVRNLGESPSSGFDVALYDGDPSQGGALLQTAHISGLNGSEVRTGTLGVTLTTNGNHTLYLTADPGVLIPELTKTNNAGTVMVNVGGTLTQADLAITPMDITLTPSRPHAGDMIQISTNIRNIGAEAANNFTVELFDGAPEAGGTLIYTRTISTAVGAEETVTTNWNIPAGIHDIYVILDRMNGINEINENNNKASVRVMTDMVDISISATDLVFNPSHPVINDTVALTITAHNTGIRDTDPFNLALYDGDPAQGGVLLQTFPVGSIPGDGSTTLTYTFTASPQTYRFYAVADAENVVAEMYEDNNQAIRSLKIKAPGETLGPDLVPIKIDLTDTATNSQTLAITGTARVTFQNKGDDKITTPFNVVVFEDSDGDARYTAGVDNLFGTGTNTLTLWPEGAGMVDVPLSGTVKFLHSPLYAFMDSGDAILEQDETNNILVSCKDCEVRPANPIQPVVKWTWQHDSAYNGNTLASTPLVVNLTDDNGDGKIDQNDIPDIVFVSFGQVGGIGTGLDYYGKLWALRGDTGATIFSIMDLAHPFLMTAHPAVGDIDNDGLPEIVISMSQGYGNVGLVVYNHDGSLKWDNRAQVTAWNMGNPNGRVTVHSDGIPAIADIDGDGVPEIITGASVINNDGSVRWGRFPVSSCWSTIAQNGNGAGSGSFVYASIVADVDFDGKQEIIAGNAVYDYNGNVKWCNTSVTDGINAVGNLDDDAYPEIVLVTPNSNRVHLLDHNGNIKWGPVILDPNWGISSPPIIADFDGDGEAEIGVKDAGRYVILDKNGTIKKTFSIPYQWPSFGYITAGTVFDLNGDNRPEVIVNSDRYFRIFDGANSSLLYENAFGTSTSNFQSVVVADVNNDGHAEIVAAGMSPTNWYKEELRVYKSQNNDWVGAGSIWNQLSYHVTNVNNDGTIPQYESPSWLLNNTYRCQARVGASTNPYLTPNLTASYMRAEQSGSALNLAVRVGNGGAVASSAGVTVTFYDGDPANGGVAIGTASTTKTLNPGDFQDVIYSWSGGSLGIHHIYAVVDAANTISECRKDDNQVNTDFTIQTAYADLKIALEDISVPAGPYYEGIPVQVTANVKNIGALPASNVLVRIYNGNPLSGGTQIGIDQTIPTINAGSTIPLTFNYDTLGKSGTNVIYIVIDPSNAVAEVSKTNNMASVTLTVQQPVLPDLAVSASDIQLTPAAPQEGDKAMVTATIHNLGTGAGNIPVGIYLGNPASGGVLVSQPTIYPILAFNTTTTVQAVIDTTGWAGQQQLYVVLDPANAITESREDNNTASKPLFIQSAGLASTLNLDKTVYRADETITATIAVSDISNLSRNLSLNLSVYDSAGNRIATISQADPVTVNPNGTITVSRTWNTGATLAGSYSITAEVAEEGLVKSRASRGFAITADKRMNATVTVDKISYNPHETAALTAVVTSQSRNTIFGNLTAAIAIAGSGGQGSGGSTVFTETRTITTLMPGATFTFKDYWSTGTNTAGTYPVTLTVKDSTGAVIATGTQTLTITNIIKPSAALKGQIAVDRQSMLSGETVSVSYNVTNTGNVDLPNVALSVLAVHVVNQTVYDTLTSQATLPMGATYTNAGTIDTTTYTAKDYFVILRANINGTEETLAGTYFRIEGAPTAPALVSPAAGSDVETLTPALTVSNASDPNDDKLFYEFELYTDSGLTQLVASSGAVSEAAGSTSYRVPAGLQENATYFWRSRASDGKLYGAWMTPASFRVNTVNDPPTAPTVSSPADNTSVATLLPVLTVGNASDPDSASLTYNFDVALDPDFTQIVASMRGVFSGQGTTSWQVPTSLQENATYYWRAQADDWLIEGPWSTPARFFVNTGNDAPTAPAVVAPANGSTITSLSADIVINNSTDPDSPILSYFFEVDSVMTFDSPDVIRSNSVPQGQGTTIWHVGGLQDNTRYHVRVKASDGMADSPWSPVVSFFANTANDAPATPVLANPSNGAGVNSFTPVLSVQDAFDPDYDVLTYEFEVYSDAAMTDLVAHAAGIVESPQVTSWTVPVSLTENLTYYWRARAFDGALTSGWMPLASFMVNTANDAPGAPGLSSPAEGSSIATLYPTLAVVNAVDPDSDRLTYDFEVYSGGTLVSQLTGVPEDISGITPVTLGTALSDNTVYQWRARAFDGDHYGPWMSMASFAIHIPRTSVNATINFDPDTLNKTSKGTWVTVYIELPSGYNVADIDVVSVKLEGNIPAELRPYALGDQDKDGIPDLMVKFKRSDVINLLPDGNSVPVHVTGKVGSTTFEGIDIIRVIP
jgi:subtilase family serine protease